MNKKIVHKNIQLYGIKNCDTVKKSLKWLQQNNFEIEFFDLKKQPLDKKIVAEWFDSIDNSVLINRRGTTWRQLHEAEKNISHKSKLIQLIIDKPTLLKRPIVFYKNNWTVGFNAAEWQQRFL